MDCYKSKSKVPTKCPKCGRALKGNKSCKCGYVFNHPLSNRELNFIRYGFGWWF